MENLRCVRTWRMPPARVRGATNQLSNHLQELEGWTGYPNFFLKVYIGITSCHNSSSCHISKSIGSKALFSVIVLSLDHWLFVGRLNSAVLSILSEIWQEDEMIPMPFKNPVRIEFIGSLARYPVADRIEIQSKSMNWNWDFMVSELYVFQNKIFTVRRGWELNEFRDSACAWYF